MQVYFIFQLVKELAPIAIFVLLTLFLFIASLIKQFQWDRKIKYLQSRGFEQYLKDVASVGGKAWYGWRYDDGTMFGMRISEDELEKISYKTLKERFPM